METHDAESDDFPSFSEGLSLRGFRGQWPSCPVGYFPSFSEGLSLRDAVKPDIDKLTRADFPSFSEGLSLRDSPFARH